MLQIQGTLQASAKTTEPEADPNRRSPVVLQPLDACEREQRMIQAYLPFLPLKQSATEGLTLSINVPNVIISVEKLPVIVFVHGGGFANGSAYHPTYDLTRFTQLSVDMDMAVIAVGVKYETPLVPKPHQTAAYFLDMLTTCVKLSGRHPWFS